LHSKSLLKYDLEVMDEKVWLEELSAVMNRGSDIIQFVQLACESFESLKLKRNFNPCYSSLKMTLVLVVD